MGLGFLKKSEKVGKVEKCRHYPLKSTEARLLAAIAAEHSCPILKTDTRQAFLYGEMGEEEQVHIRPPDWWPEPIPDGPCSLVLLGPWPAALLAGVGAYHGLLLSVVSRALAWHQAPGRLRCSQMSAACVCVRVHAWHLGDCQPSACDSARCR